MPTSKLTHEILHAALLGFEEQKKRIDAQIAGIRQMLDGSGSSETATTPKPQERKRRKISAAGRKAIAEAQRKRWAASRGQSESLPAAAPAKPKRKLSAAGKAAIVAALKKRWAAKKAGVSKPAAAKKTAAKKAIAKKSAKVPATAAQ